jgi:hypothetical protein
VLPIDWSTLGLQLGAFFAILTYAIAGARGVTTQRASQLSMIGLWVSRFSLPMTRRGERFVISAFVLTAGVSALLVGQFVFQDFPYSGDEWSYVLQAEIFSRGRLHFDQLAIFSPLGAYLLLLALKRRATVRQLLWFGVSHAMGVLLLAYNYMHTGDPRLLGYHVGYGAPLVDFRLLGRQFIGEYFLHLLVWTFPFVPLLALFYSIWPGETGRSSLTEQRWDTPLCLVFCPTSSGMPLYHIRRHPGRRFFRYEYDETKRPNLWQSCLTRRSRPEAGDSMERWSHGY